MMQFPCQKNFLEKKKTDQNWRSKDIQITPTQMFKKINN